MLPDNAADTNLAVIGLGKLGAPLLAVLSQKYHVVGVDTNADICKSLEKGRSPYFEADVDDILAKNRSRYRIANNVDDALENASVVFIALPTPSDDKGRFDCSYVLRVCRQIGWSPKLKPYHFIVVVSTVMPTQIEGEVIPALEEGGKKLGRHFALCYNPSFIALGTVVRNILSPDMVLIGESGGEAGSRLAEIHTSLCVNKPPVLRMNFINAEITKLALNTFITVKLSYANMIARLCEKLPNADSGIVLSAIGIDKRVGGAYFKGAIGYGGPCFPRDNVALINIGGDIGADVSIIRSVHEFNERQPQYLYNLITRYIAPVEAIVMLGVTYKPDTHSIEFSQAWSVLNLLAADHSAGFYDPQAVIPGERAVKRFASAMECIGQGQILIIGTPWEEFRTLGEAINKSAIRCVIDLWNMLPADSLAKHIKLVQLGKGVI
jgi:UDPglucose 6-dehydrogenase